ncbi:MAG: Wzz/FepE/Etk N-terminal domain-containing protein [Streptosporangiaceae bacterium]
MSEQALDLRRALQVIWRRKRLVAIFVGAGLLAGAGYTAISPPVPTSQALVILPSGIKDLQTQVVIASSDPVLRVAQQSLDKDLSLQEMRNNLAVKAITSNVISITAADPTAMGAEHFANAVAQSYITLLGSASSPGGQLQARALQSAATASQTPLFIQMLETGGIGIALGLLIGAIVVLALSRGDKRLRERDEIADSIGIPVLASIPVAHPSDAAGWARLLSEYDPAVVHAWRLRILLRELGLGEASEAGSDDADGLSVAVLSLAADPRALALGPQLAVFAASLGIGTTLLVAAQPEATVSTALRTACAAPSAARQAAGLQIAVGDQSRGTHQPATLTVVVAVVDASKPQLADLKPATATLLGVSAGTATAAQLASVALSAADAGRQIAGVLVADPLPGDRTTGRLPQLARSVQGTRPTRLTGTTKGAGR